MSVVIALDLGTTGNRAIAFDKTGKPLASAYYEFKQHFPKPAWVEHDPKEIFKTTMNALNDIIDQIGVDCVSAIGITNQRETAVLWDKHTGEPVYNAIVWQCRRTTDRCNQLSDSKDMIKEKTGLFLDPYFSATKIEWIINNVEGVKSEIEKGNILFGTIDTWILWKLTDGKKHCTDPSNASRTMLYNIHNQDYDDDLLKLFSIPKNILPVIKDSIDDFGTLQSSYFGKEIPINAMIGDQQSALFCQCGQDKGALKNTYGTGLFLMSYTGDIIAKTNRLIQTVAWKINGKISYALEGSVFVGGSAIQWLRDELGIINEAKETESLALSLESNDDVYLVPAFAGLGAPYWDPTARGVLIGITRGTTKAHIVRATLESLAYQTQEIIKDIQVNNPDLNFKSLRVDGGASLNNFLMQFQADISSISVERPIIVETTAYGAAGLAGIKAGLWTEDEFRKTVVINKNFLPSMDENTRDLVISKWKKAVNRSLNWV
ncbi:glycerol kinase [Candidatus Marinamargulisbacteria bacterium SCGC AAA071-K20]|nr:glycerol kinase [Candidatus Marinamargulisbacteria bacterium SCGC AAA071-K20]